MLAIKLAAIETVVKDTENYSISALYGTPIIHKHHNTHNTNNIHNSLHNSRNTKKLRKYP